MDTIKPLCIVGNPDITHVGSSLRSAALALGKEVVFLSVKDAYFAPWVIEKFNWILRGHLPSRLDQFSSEVFSCVRLRQPNFLVTTGIAPLNASSLRKIKESGITCINYLTDDPWNPAHRAGWFLEALPLYDAVFSPRRANLGDLKKCGCPRSEYLPFAYDPAVHFHQPAASDEERRRLSSDLVFIGNADQERFAWLEPLAKEGIRLALYGKYWERSPLLRPFARGIADAATMRLALSETKVALCLVREANRDGHSMRSFEIPAIGACMLTQDTEEHREIFGGEAECVLYFSHPEELLQKLRLLLENEALRRDLERRVQKHIVSGKNTYKDRLVSMIG